jgi:brefeldin A-resistance guanine nucleotide exchange factor 1
MPKGMDETRVSAANLVSKVFLRYLSSLAQGNDLQDMWIKIITIMDRLMNSGQGGNLVRCSLRFVVFPRNEVLTIL